MSDTPETDALAMRHCANWDNQGDHVREIVPSDHARKLERDLSAAQALMIEMIAQKNVEAAELRKQRDGLRDALEHMASHHRCGCGHPACKRCADDRINDEVIASVKGGCR